MKRILTIQDISCLGQCSLTVALPIMLSTNNKKKAVIFTLLSGITEPIGALLAFLVLRFFLTELVLGAIFGVVGGIMIYIALDDLIPSSRKYNFKKYYKSNSFMFRKKRK